MDISASLFPVMKAMRRIMKLMNWLRAVAMAAPAVPNPNTKMNNGSKAMFSTPPVVMPTIA